MPRSPNPGATKIPFSPFKCSETFPGVRSSEWIQRIVTLVSLDALAWINASVIDLYESCNSTYLPIRPTSTVDVGFLYFFKKLFQTVKIGCFSSLNCSFLRTTVSKPSSNIKLGTS